MDLLNFQGCLVAGSSPENLGFENEFEDIIEKIQTRHPLSRAACDRSHDRHKRLFVYAFRRRTAAS
jgi:hypothetical protein